MQMIMEVKGVPPRSVLARATRRKVFFDDDYQPILTPNSRGKVRMPSQKVLANIMDCPDKDFVDFIDVKLYSNILIEMHRMENRCPYVTRSGLLSSIHSKSCK